MSKHYPFHTFVIRVAPARSKFAGRVCAELRCVGALKALQPLREMGLEYTEMERWVHPTLGWKLLRFEAAPVALWSLYDQCSSSELDHVRDETERHLQALTIAAGSADDDLIDTTEPAPMEPLEPEALENYTLVRLRELAKHRGIKRISRLNKKQLIQSLL